MNVLEIMNQVKEGKLTEEQAAKLIEEQSANAVKAATKKKLTLKVSPKGAVQLDGLRRFPVTLYRDEWEQVLDISTEIKTFIAANKHRLAEKGE
jgi:hypothetical protein